MPVLAFIIPFLFYDRNISDPMPMHFFGFLVSLFYVFIYWNLSRQLFMWGRKKYLGIDSELRRMMVQYGILALVITAISGSLSPIACYIINGPGVFTLSFLVKDVVVAQFVSVVVCSIYESAYFFSKYKQSELKAEKLKHEIVKSQLKSLKSQVNPHFLFNSLNTLVSIIPDDPQVAVEFVRKLSKVYRYILEMSDTELITLAEEMDFLKSYIFLQEIRFGSKFKVTINVPPDTLNHSVVPLALQILVENAIKHNVVSTEKPLHITMEVDGRDKLIVRNNLQLREQVVESTGTGLSNISNRYQLVAGKQVERIVTTTAFIVVLPLVTQNEPVHARAYS